MIGADWRNAPTEQQIQSLRRRFPTEPRVDDALTRKMRGRSGPAYLPRRIESVEASLRTLLSTRLAGGFEIGLIRPLAGGSAKEQFSFELTRDGATAKKLVLRMEPPEGSVQTHRLREFQALDVLRETLPVPHPFWVDPDGSELGQPGLIYEFCRGVSRPPAGTQMSGAQQGYGEHYTRLLGPQFVERLAEIGVAPWAHADLSAFTPPRAGTTEATIMGIDWWERVWEEDRREAVPLMTYTARWLRDNAPVTERVSLIHGDYRTGNFLFDLDSGDITALLDWELVHLGDRHEDITYTMSPLMGSTDAKGRFLVAGFFPVDEYLDRYQRHSGLPIDADRLTYYKIFNFWRQVVITYATSHRAVIGRKTHQDILVGTSAMVAGVVFQSLHDALREVV
jgi:aminoglycoside phosphotransferase (APT) family kinase protein